MYGTATAATRTVAPRSFSLSLMTYSLVSPRLAPKDVPPAEANVGSGGPMDTGDTGDTAAVRSVLVLLRRLGGSR